MRLRHLIILLLLICFGAGIASAQDAPPGVFDAAVRAANAAKPGLGRASGWQWQRLNPTKSSSLGCPLVQGTDLGREVTPYSASLAFGAETYMVYVSADGTLSQPCDPKFGALTASTPAPPSGCQLAADAQPTFRIAPDTSTAILGGEVLTNGVAYAIGRTDTREWYQTRNKANQIGWVSAKEVTANGACDPLPITGAQNIDYVTIPCFVTAAQDFSNVRQTATTDGEILARLYENVYYQVYAITTDGQWLFINPGWVADRVTEKYGDCDNLEVNNSLVGVPPGTPTPFPTATPTVFVSPTPFPTATATIFASPTVFVSPTPRPTATPVTCPGNPAGFLPPRLTFGQANARVIPGGEPNRLRADPSTQALQVGTVQPGRTLDAVLNGPVCEGSYVWWFVEADGVQGWTVESDASEEGAYYLEPIGVPVSNGPIATTAPVAAATSAPIVIEVGTAAPTIAPGQGLFLNRVLLDIREEEGVEAIRDIRFYDNDHLIAVAGDRYFQVDVSAADKLDDWTSDFTPIQALDFTETQSFILDFQSTLRIKPIGEDDTNLEMVALETQTDSPTLSVTSDGRYALTVGCNNADCTQGKIDLWETATGKLIRSQPAHPDQPWGAAFSADDSRIISWGFDGFQIWDTQSGQFVFAYDDVDTMLHALSETEPTLYTLSCDMPISDTGCRSIRVNATDLETGETSHFLIIEGGEFVGPVSVAISPNNQWMAVALSNESVLLYNLAGDLSQPTEILETGQVNGVMTFNKDVTRLAVGNFEGMAQLWTVPQS